MMRGLRDTRELTEKRAHTLFCAVAVVDILYRAALHNNNRQCATQPSKGEP